MKQEIKDIKDQVIRWDSSSNLMRQKVCELVGWCTKKEGKITRMGQRIAKTNWNELSAIVRDILTRHGVTQ